MAGRIPLGLVTGDTVDQLFAEIGVDDNGGDNPDNDLVIRDSNRNVVLRYDESAGAWVPGKFAFEDSTADPSANGELQRNGADLKAYSGGAVRNLSDVGAGALTDSGTDTDGGDDYTLPNAADNINLQGDGAIQNADSVSTDELNRTLVLDPAATDFGAAVNDAVANMSDGDALYVPPVPYTTDTTAVVDKFITVFGDAGIGAEATPYPTITKSSDVPVFSIEEKSVLRGIRVEGSGSDTTPGIEVRKKCVLDGVASNNNGAEGILGEQRTDTENINYSRWNVEARGNGSDGVYLGDDGSAPVRNTNACKIYVADGQDNNGHAVNLGRGFANYIAVQHAAGSNMTSAIRFGDGPNYGEVYYADDGIANGVVFDDEPCHADLHHIGSNTNEAVFNNPNNSWRAIYPTTGADYTSNLRSYGIDAPVDLLNNSIDGVSQMDLVNNNGDAVTRFRYEDNSGRLLIESPGAGAMAAIDMSTGDLILNGSVTENGSP